MVTVKHPRWPDITRDVPDEDVSRWVASGWLDERPDPECCDGEVRCADCPVDDLGPAVKILPAPKPAPRRRAKNPSIGDD